VHDTFLATHWCSSSLSPGRCHSWLHVQDWGVMAPLLTVLTTKIRPSKHRVWEDIWQVSCIFLLLIKFHELCCDVYRKVHILGDFRTNAPHVLGTAGPARHNRPCPVVRLWSRAPPLPRAQLGRARFTEERRFDQRVEARINGSTYLIAQLSQPTSRGDPKRPLTHSVHHTAWGWAGRT
jgi:hypothetical protein